MSASQPRPRTEPGADDLFATQPDGEDPSTLAFGPSLDATGLKAIHKRFSRVNNERLKRVRSALSSAQRDFFDLVPLLFHTNHPMLPGYVGKSVPYGVAQYSPTNAALAAARRLTRSFDFKRRATRSVEIHALYLMGSSGTVAYSRASDFDIWVCHSGDISQAALDDLTRKSEAISKWADSLGLEVHFFNLCADTFREGKIEALSSESSGSTQHHLLLDEFYRTALLIAGRFPAWWLVPPEQEHNYHQVVATIRERRLISDSEFLDFGTASELRASEFVGAALWQLTKAIASPHKSLLKIMLIEAYASEYPHVDLLSTQLKRAVYDGERSLDKMDPYVVFVQKVEDYLLRSGDDDRVDLARQCFYLKVNVALSRLAHRSDRRAEDWRTTLVEDVVEPWGWSDSKIARLDARGSWRIDDVIVERSAMVRALIHAYKFITRFSRDHEQDTRVSKRDRTILGRKLFAAFEHKAGKVSIVNRSLENDLAEPHITVTRTAGHEGRDIWEVYRGRPPIDGRTRAPNEVAFKRTSTLIELLTWCYFNGVLERHTRVSVQQANVQIEARDIEILHSHLRAHFPPDSTRLPDVDEVARSPELLAASTFVNLGIDPMESYTRQGKRLTSSHVDALSYGGRHENLVREIDYVVLNSWREVLALKFHGIPGLLDALCEHLRWAIAAKHQRPPNVPCNCFTPGYAHAISQRISTLFDDVTEWYFAGRDVPSRVYILKGEDRYYALTVNADELNTDSIGTLPELLRYLGRSRDQYTAVHLDSFALTGTPLALVYEINAPGQINCSYYVEQKTAHLYVTDENGALFHDRVAFHTDATMIRHLHTFFESVQYRQDVQAECLDETASREITFHRIVRGTDQRYHLKALTRSPELHTGFGFEVQVIGERIDGATQFTLYCDGHEFSTVEHGEAVFEALARHVVAKRKGGERYPIHITDIDLSQIADAHAGSARERQTIHYLHYKKRIEDQLNAVIPNVEPALAS